MVGLRARLGAKGCGDGKGKGNVKQREGGCGGGSRRVGRRIEVGWVGGEEAESGGKDTTHSLWSMPLHGSCSLPSTHLHSRSPLSHHTSHLAPHLTSHLAHCTTWVCHLPPPLSNTNAYNSADKIPTHHDLHAPPPPRGWVWSAGSARRGGLCGWSGGGGGINGSWIFLF